MAETENVQKDYLAPLEEHEDGVSQGISIINTAEINQQIATAHRYPRSITSFRRRIYEMVTLDVETAESCIYSIPRDGKMIVGESIRFAEILAVAWGNYRAATEVTDVGDRYVTAQGVFFDLETNGAIQAKTMRRIVGKSSKDHPNGKRFGDDMIVTTGNAAASIALRNAITRGIPKALWKELFDEAKKVAGGNAQTFGARRDKVMKEIGIQGATPDQIFALLGVKGIDDITTEHVVHLRGLQNAIKDGETTVDEAFAPAPRSGEAIPPKPKESAFAREDRKPAAQPSEPAKAAEPAAEQQAAQAPAEARQEPVQAKDDGEAARRDEARQALVKLAQTELATQDKVKKVNDLEKDVLTAGFMTEEEEKAFSDACSDKRGAIVDAAVAARKASK